MIRSIRQKRYAIASGQLAASRSGHDCVGNTPVLEHAEQCAEEIYTTTPRFSVYSCSCTDMAFPLLAKNYINRACGHGCGDWWSKELPQVVGAFLYTPGAMISHRLRRATQPAVAGTRLAQNLAKPEGGRTGTAL